MKAPSAIWKYLVDAYDDETGNSFIHCTLCKKDIKYNHKSNVYGHLRSKHPHEYQSLTKKHKLKIRQYKIDTTNPTWEHFTIASTESGKIIVSCKICNKQFLKNTSNMLYHLTRVHRIEVATRPVKIKKVPKKITDSVTQESLKLVRRRRRCQKEDEEKTPIPAEIEPVPPPPEIVEEPNIIYDDDQDTKISLNLITPEASRESTLVQRQLKTTSDTNLQPESSTPIVDSSKGCSVYQRGSARSLNNPDLNATISDIRLSLEDFKSRIFDSDLRFFKSVSEEFRDMSEEAKDLVKAGLWQFIFKVKSTIRNKERRLSLTDLIIENLLK